MIKVMPKFADIATLVFILLRQLHRRGGALLTNNKKIYEKANLLREHGIIRDATAHWRYKVNVLGYNFRLPDINCALGISQLKKINKFISARKKFKNFIINYFPMNQKL